MTRNTAADKSRTAGYENGATSPPLNLPAQGWLRMSRKLVPLALLCLCCPPGMATRAVAAYAYKVTVLGSSDATDSYAYGVNSQGKVAGVGGPYSQSFLDHAGGDPFQYLRTLAGSRVSSSAV